MDGRALTATELADAVGVTRSTMSSHLSRLQQAQLIAAESQGRHRYFRIANADVAELLEGMMGLAQLTSPQQTFGPRDPALRKARLCYDHLAGELGVLIYDGLERQGSFVHRSDGLTMNDSGWSLLSKLGMSVARLPQTRRPLCRACVDWSERRHHLAGALGAALAARLMELRWAKRVPHSRALHVTAQGEKSIREIFAR
ncbi:ArsR family transcriptional regulator [Steroidobacter agaridevorans]|uniref:ArsR family transcriptional regulator n=2 Tax=Steroidobacter agaridevorans TaxID=2695856 RepID=A0A829YE11_9GAMM|nr:ArsR family transcriptional regulator [Steroidobacter agaridevorans]